MEKEKNDKVEPDKAPKEKKPLTEEQRIKRNKMIAIPCMCPRLRIGVMAHLQAVCIRG